MNYKLFVTVKKYVKILYNIALQLRYKIYGNVLDTAEVEDLQ